MKEEAKEESECGWIFSRRGNEPAATSGVERNVWGSPFGVELIFSDCRTEKKSN
jgi:hypothetical protein